ncbi:MAG: hypothetical protein RBS78_05305 [Coriobacteriia bacterium]|jgi:uncharacterized spore protein YtfJ|nr:hypothetical protein [Coriobacteriia bacterium]
MSERPVISSDDFERILKDIGESANARTVFGETVVSGGRAIIPVARVHHRGGGGVGGGGGTDVGHVHTAECPPECDEGEQQGFGSGMGLGYTIVAEPVGVIEVTADEVYWIPTLDVNRLTVIGAIAAAAVAVIVAAGRLLRA